MKKTKGLNFDIEQKTHLDYLFHPRNMMQFCAVVIAEIKMKYYSNVLLAGVIFIKYKRYPHPRKVPMIENSKYPRSLFPTIIVFASIMFLPNLWIATFAQK